MPELPDVEIFRRRVADGALGRTIERTSVRDSGILEGISPAALERRLKGRTLTTTRRHGKHLFVSLAEDGVLAMHFGMSGGLQIVAEGASEPPYAKVLLEFTDGARLAYTCRRRLGRVAVAVDEAAFVEAAGLGRDALDPGFDAAAWRRLLAGRRRDIKSLLMDQGLVAGIGNVYSDEILFQARIHPRKPAAGLSEAETRRLWEAIRQVLEAAIAYGAGSETGAGLPEGYLLRERRKGGRCPRGHGPLASEKHGGRTAYFCPVCQPP